MPTARGIMRGDLAITGFSELMQLLAMGLKRGRLTLSSGEMAAALFLVDGAVAHATVSTRRERLGDVLVARGLLRRAQIESAIIGARAAGQRIGEYLVAQQVVSPAVVAACVRQQVEAAVYACCALEAGTFTFDPAATPDPDELAGGTHLMATEALLLEGARRVDEWRVIAQHVPTFDVVFAVDADLVRTRTTPMTEHQRFVLGLVDGHRDVQRIVATSGFDEFGVAHALNALASAGFIRAVDRSRATARVADDKVDEHRFLGRTFARGRMHREAEREYRQVVQARPNDRAALAALGVLALRDGRVADAIRWLEDASAGDGAGQPGATSATTASSAGLSPEHDDARVTPVLRYTLALAYERDGRLDAAAEVLSRVSESPDLGWLLAFARGRVALRRGHYAEALALLEPLGAGTQRTMPIGWWHALALTHALRGDTARAIDLAKLGVAAHPKAPRLCALLATCAERRGAYDEARVWAERGLRDQPDYGPCLKNRADALYGLREFAAARGAYELAVARPVSESADAWFKLGNVLARLREPVQAQRAWREALRLEPGHQTARSNLDVMGTRDVVMQARTVSNTPRPSVASSAAPAASAPNASSVVAPGKAPASATPSGDADDFDAGSISFDVY